MNTIINRRNHSRRQVEEDIALIEGHIRANTRAIDNLQSTEQPFKTGDLIAKKKRTISKLEEDIVALRVKLQNSEDGHYDDEFEADAQAVKRAVLEKSQKTAAKKANAASTNMMKGTARRWDNKKTPKAKTAPVPAPVPAPAPAPIILVARPVSVPVPIPLRTEQQKTAIWGPAGCALRNQDYWNSFIKKEAPKAAALGTGAGSGAPAQNEFKTPYQRFVEKSLSMNERLTNDLKNMHENEGRLFKGITFYGFLPSKRNFTLVEESLREGGYQTHHTYIKDNEKVYEVWKGRRFKRGPIISVRRTKCIDASIEKSFY